MDGIENASSSSSIGCLPTQIQMPTVALNLVLAETRIFSGNSLNATVLLDSADPDNTIIEFFAEILGIGKTGWINIRTDKIYETEYEFVHFFIPLCQRNVNLSPGRHRFNLHVNIPETAPSSLESQFGSIRYTIRLQLIGNAEHCSALEVFPFLVVAKSYLDQLPLAILKHIDYEDEINFTVCTLPFGVVRLRISLNRTGFSVGEVIQVCISIKNGSRKQLKECCLQLVLKSHFLAQSRYEQANDTKLVETLLDSHKIDNIKGRSEINTEECLLRIPEQTIPTMHSPIISLSYVLRFIALPGIETEIPLYITSLGYKNSNGKNF
ncbi:Arrestin_C domain-containing protein [Meloidogyne graminicola]|uniref:Arrestin_C domain-containing protein n=1 Tax=Meloidogyne graminicola TaxID=189291 RepID=A0A8S9ZNC1_9BILA|nr:Arrestin_C domain-containing protein [Meloidogyne graminicola]